MSHHQPRRRKGRGAIPNWSPDSDSEALLRAYKAGRVESTPRPADSTISTEYYYLTGMVFASKSLGGPDTLRGLRDSPQTIVKILREWPRTRRTLNGMLAAMLRVIEITVTGPRAQELRTGIMHGLYPRPSGKRPWNIVRKTVGGSREVQRRRPILSPTDLRRIADSASLSSPSGCGRRDEALAALLCYSGIHPYEVNGLRWDQVEWLKQSDHPPWCAMIHGVSRRGRLICVPVLDEARCQLEMLASLAAPGLGGHSGYVFESSRGRGRPIGHSMARIVVRRALKSAGLPNCDDTALKRAYAALLKQRGLGDYAIRDALGLQTMAAVDRHLERHRRRAAQRAATEHLSLIAPVADEESPGWPQLPFDDDHDREAS